MQRRPKIKCVIDKIVKRKLKNIFAFFQILTRPALNSIPGCAVVSIDLFWVFFIPFWNGSHAFPRNGILDNSL